MNNFILLANYIASLLDFEIFFPKPHEYRVATFVYSFLQAGISYRFIVKPSIEKIKQNFLELSTTSAYQNAKKRGKLIEHWKKLVKTNSTKAITSIFIVYNIETEYNLNKWIEKKHFLI